MRQHLALQNSAKCCPLSYKDIPIPFNDKGGIFMFKSESWQSHDEYRTIVDTYGHRLSRNNPRYHFDLYYKEQQKLLSLNLDTVRDYIAGYYSNTGRPAKNQAQILRSLILFVLLFNKTPAKTSLTAWVCKVLPDSVSLAVLLRGHVHF